MSKKLDEIISDLTFKNEQRVTIDKTILIQQLKEAYIAGRDDATDFILSNSEVLCTPEDDEPFSDSTIYAAELYKYDDRDGYTLSVDSESILAAKTEKTLQP